MVKVVLNLLMKEEAYQECRACPRMPTCSLSATLYWHFLLAPPPLNCPQFVYKLGIFAFFTSTMHNIYRFQQSPFATISYEQWRSCSLVTNKKLTKLGRFYSPASLEKFEPTSLLPDIQRMCYDNNLSWMGAGVTRPEGLKGAKDQVKQTQGAQSWLGGPLG